MGRQIDVSDPNWQKFRDDLAGAEGGNAGYSAGQTGNKHLGRYQFGEDLLIDMGYYVKDCTPKTIDWKGSWTGKNKINSRKDFIDKHDVQDAAFDEAMQYRLTQTIERLGLDKYVGSTIGGVQITWAGLLASVWLEPKSTMDFLKSNGATNTPDSNGETPKNRFQKFASNTIPFSTDTGYEAPRVPSFPGFNPACPTSAPLSNTSPVSDPETKSGPYHWIGPNGITAPKAPQVQSNTLLKSFLLEATAGSEESGDDCMCGKGNDPREPFKDAQDDSGSVVRRDPVVLDLDGDGIQSVSPLAGSCFDYGGDGFAELTGWFTPDNGVLVLDRNGDGIVNDGGELFGDETVISKWHQGCRRISGSRRT